LSERCGNCGYGNSKNRSSNHDWLQRLRSTVTDGNQAGCTISVQPILKYAPQIVIVGLLLPFYKAPHQKDASHSALREQLQPP
jgi:hypothetical protein